jgi:hypothetical protein
MYLSEGQIRDAVVATLAKFKGNYASALNYIRNFDKQLYREIQSEGLLKELFPPAKLKIARHGHPPKQKLGDETTKRGRQNNNEVIRKLIEDVLTEKSSLDVDALTNEVLKRYEPVPPTEADIKIARKSINGRIWNMLKTDYTLHGLVASTSRTNNLHLASACRNPNCVEETQALYRIILRKKIDQPTTSGFVSGLTTECHTRKIPPPKYFYTLSENNHRKPIVVCTVKVYLTDTDVIEGQNSSEIRKDEKEKIAKKGQNAPCHRRAKEAACKIAYRKLTDIVKEVPKRAVSRSEEAGV